MASPPTTVGEEPFLQFWGEQGRTYHIHFTAEETEAHRGPALPLITQLLSLTFYAFHGPALRTGSLKLVL